MNRRALDGREKNTRKDHPNTLTSVINLAVVLQDREKYQVAEEMNRRGPGKDGGNEEQGAKTEKSETRTLTT